MWHFKNRAVSFDRSIFLCGYSATILTFPPTSLWEREAINLACDFQGIRLFCCFGQMQALAPATKKTWSATPRLNMCNKEYGLWGCGDRKILYFQRYPRFTSLPLGGRVCVLVSTLRQKKSKVFTSLLYLRILRNYIFVRLMRFEPVLADAGVGDEGNAQRGDALH